MGNGQWAMEPDIVRGRLPTIHAASLSQALSNFHESPTVFMIPLPNAMPPTFSWLQTDVISELLAEHYPLVDPLQVRFTQLRKLVTDLPGFKEEPGHPVNEKILETIQAAWIEEREDRAGEDEEG